MILNNQEWLLAIFKKKGLTPTGKLEFATIDGIDSALAQALNEAFDSQVVSFNDRINQSFREFLKRTPRDRITLGTFSDVKEWLSSFEADRAGRKDTASAGPVNKLAMPLVNLSRSPAFSIYEGELCRDNYDEGHVTNENDEIEALVSTIPFSLEYSLWIASDEKESLGMVTTALAFWLRMYASLGQASFTHRANVGGYEIPVTCYIEGQKSIAFQDLTTGTADNRLFAVGLNLTVVAELPILAYMKQTNGTITVKAKILEA
ncbi:baseplate [Escherichia coli]|nr:baseplate [Escherichia coli]